MTGLHRPTLEEVLADVEARARENSLGEEETQALLGLTRWSYAQQLNWLRPRVETEIGEELDDLAEWSGVRPRDPGETDQSVRERIRHYWGYDLLPTKENE